MPAGPSRTSVLFVTLAAGVLVRTASGAEASGGLRPPEGCTAWHDGCNTCEVVGGVATTCTAMACLTTTAPYCMAYAPGTACTSNKFCGRGLWCGSRVDGDPRWQETWSTDACQQNSGGSSHGAAGSYFHATLFVWRSANEIHRGRMKNDVTARA